eukprot:Rhum_TRINITY_DN15026_c0_g1::Rhum_TRINITY_DN15026_c0_g1_i1::g.133964::m.133964
MKTNRDGVDVLLGVSETRTRKRTQTYTVGSDSRRRTNKKGVARVSISDGERQRSRLSAHLGMLQPATSKETQMGGVQSCGWSVPRQRDADVPCRGPSATGASTVEQDRNSMARQWRFVEPYLLHPPTHRSGLCKSSLLPLQLFTHPGAGVHERTRVLLGGCTGDSLVVFHGVAEKLQHRPVAPHRGSRHGFVVLQPLARVRKSLPVRRYRSEDDGLVVLQVLTRVLEQLAVPCERGAHNSLVAAQAGIGELQGACVLLHGGEHDASVVLQIDADRLQGTPVPPHSEETDLLAVLQPVAREPHDVALAPLDCCADHVFAVAQARAGVLQRLAALGDGGVDDGGGVPQRSAGELERVPALLDGCADDWLAVLQSGGGVLQGKRVPGDFCQHEGLVRSQGVACEPKRVHIIPYGCTDDVGVVL